MSEIETIPDANLLEEYLESPIKKASVGLAAHFAKKNSTEQTANEEEVRLCKEQFDARIDSLYNELLRRMKESGKGDEGITNEVLLQECISQLCQSAAINMLAIFSPHKEGERQEALLKLEETKEQVLRRMGGNQPEAKNGEETKATEG